jgi:aerobic-type carbon monoxide dehydrogenase small subunit (CoxS/CutS family)
MPTTRNVIVSCTGHSPNQSRNFPSAHTHTSHRLVRTQHRRSVNAPPTSGQLSPLGKVFFQNQKNILNTHFLYHFAVYCLYCTITSPCTSYNVQSLERVLPLLHKHFAVYFLLCTITSTCTAPTVNHFTVYCLYYTITSTCSAPTVQSLHHVLPLLYNHFAMYCLYCTITSPCIASTVQPLRRVFPITYNHFNVYCPYCTITSLCTASTVQSLHVLPLPYNHFAVYRLYCIITTKRQNYLL